MNNSGTDGVAWRFPLRRSLLIAAALLGPDAMAQTTSQELNATDPATPTSAARPLSEAVLRQARGPYRIILRSAAIAPTGKVTPPVAPAVTPAHEVATKRPTRPSEAASPPAPVAIVAPEVQAMDTPPAVPVPPPAEPASAPLAVAASSPEAPIPIPAVVAARTALIAIENEPPVLSGALAREAPQGVVRVAFTVKPDGSTADHTIAASSNRRLNNPAIAALSKWRYQPIDSAQSAEVEFEFLGD